MHPSQVSTDIFLQDIFFTLAAVAVVLAFAGLGFIDSGLSRHKNVLDNWVQKMIAGIVAALGFIIVGYAVWNWQFNSAVGVRNPLSSAISTWWLGGSALTHFAADLSPSAVPEADVLQIFAVFFITFAMLIGAFFHSAGLERLRPVPLYISTFVVAAVVWPLLSYLVWGSASPLTARGLHDFTGDFNLYIFVGAWSVVTAWKLGPRIGAFTADARGEGPRAHDLAHVAIGVVLLMFAIPFIALGSGYISPGAGYYGISLSSSGFGLVLLNIFMAYVGGALCGAVIAYRTRNPIWVFLGPIAGYICCSCLADFAKPWECLLIALLGPLAAWGTQALLTRLRIDDQKLGPLALGPGVVGAIMSGLVGWGVKTGGYFGITKGTYAFQGARINLGWQLIGVVVAAGFAVVSALVLYAVLGRFMELRISEEQERVGLDISLWGTPNDQTASAMAVAEPPLEPAASPAAV